MTNTQPAVGRHREVREPAYRRIARKVFEFAVVTLTAFGLVTLVTLLVDGGRVR